MEIETRYAAKLFFPNPAFVQIYFEAIANAFDAKATAIRISISTDGQINPSHLEITIKDDGEGFTDERFERFRRLQEPVDKFHKGLGRLVFLHYFSSVHISSCFDGMRRSFTFSTAFKGDSNVSAEASQNPSGSSLVFNGFSGDRLRSYDDLKPGVLKDKIIEHFLP